MALTSEGIGLLFRAKGDTSDARKAFSDLKNSIDTTVTAAGGTTGGFGAFTRGIAGATSGSDALSGGLSGVTGKLGGMTAAFNPATLAIGVATAAATVAATAAAELTKTLFDLSVSASEFGSEIFDASQKTGLGAESLSALKFAAEQNGSSFETLQNGIRNFSITMGQAADGSEKAQEKLKKLGVTSTDLEGGLAQVFKRISELKPGIEQNTAAAAAFGKKLGSELLPMIRDAGGDYTALIQKAKDLGVTITDENAAAADAFGDQLDLFKTQLAGVGRTIGFEVMPVFMEMAGAMSKWLVNNRKDVEYWSVGVGVAFKNTINNLGKIKDWLIENQTIIRILLATATLGTSELGIRIFGKLSGDLDAQIKAEQTRRARDPKEGGGYRYSLKDDIDDETSKIKTSAKKMVKTTSAEMRNFFESIGAVITSELRPPGTLIEGTKKISKHATREAVDVRTRDKTIEEIVRIIAAGLEKGYRVYDERLKKNQPHLHWEANALKPSTFYEDRPELYGGANMLAALKAIDERRRQKKSGEDVLEKELKKQTDAEEAVTKKAADEAAKRLKIWEEEWKRRKELGKAGTDFLIFQLEREIKAATDEERGADAIALANNLRVNKLQLIQDEIDTLEELYDQQTNEDEKKRIRHEIDLKTIKYQEAEIELNEKLEEQIKDINDAIDRQNKLREEQTARIDELLQISLKIIKDSKDEDEEEENIFDKWRESWEKFVEGFKESAKIKNILADLSQMFQNAFRGMAQAIGSVVQQWVLYGNTGPGVMRKILAAALATLAAEAAVRAVYHLAMGFALLFFDPGAAAQQFIAAGIFAAVAGTAALAGRAIAGDAFKQQNQGAFGTTATSGGGDRGTGGQGRVYSQYGDDVTVINAGRNAPDTTRFGEIIVTFKDRSDWFSQMFEFELRKNGRLRQLILDTT